MQKIVNKVRCIHRHTIDEHPGCFAQGIVSDTRESKLIPWFKEEDLKIAILDIEATGLKPEWGIMLTWCIREKGGEVIYTDVVTKEDLFNGTLDKRIIESLVTQLQKYKVVIGYYSNGYDLPYVRAKALHYDIPFPGYKLEEKKHGGTKYTPIMCSWDLYPVVKYKLNLSRNSLDNVCDYLGIPGKTPISKEVWRRAAYGDAESIAQVLEHNIADCEITDKLHDKLYLFNKWGRNSI